MTQPKHPFEQFYVAKHLLLRSLLIFPVSITIGLLVALLYGSRILSRYPQAKYMVYFPVAGSRHPDLLL